jgi:DNA-binding transcriptional MerR regulator
MSDEMTLAELAGASGVPARTIRFYIARGILEGPVKAGRGAAYTAEHLGRLERIQQLQAKGRTLSEIGRALDGQPEPAPKASAWWEYQVAEDVRISVRADMNPWRTKQVRAAVEEMARRLGKENRDS